MIPKQVATGYISVPLFMTCVLEPFEFEEGGRTYRCHVRLPSAGLTDSWWWFEVSGDQQSYAPFRAAKGDTRASVRARVLTFYGNRLARLAEPPAPRYRGRPPANAAAKPAATPE